MLIKYGNVTIMYGKLTHLENIQKYAIGHPLRQQRCELARDKISDTN